jgi:hypothetical protein
MPPFDSPGGKAKKLLSRRKGYYTAGRVQRQVGGDFHTVPPLGPFKFNLKFPNPNFSL